MCHEFHNFIFKMSFPSGKARSVNTSCLHYALSLLSTPHYTNGWRHTNRRQHTHFGVCIWRGHFLMHNGAHPNKQTVHIPQHFGPWKTGEWTVQHWAYGKCTIIFVGKREEKSLLGRNTRGWLDNAEMDLHILNPNSQFMYCQAEHSTILHTSS